MTHAPSTLLLPAPRPAVEPGSTTTPAPRPGRRLLLLGAGTMTVSLALGIGPADAAPTLRRGSRGSSVGRLQRNLADLGYWCGRADGSFGHLTQQAVWALQKAADLKADGVVGPKTHRALDRDTRPRPTIRSGTAFEVDLSEQLLMCISGGRLTYILNTSTGSGKRYYSGGRWKTATTPKGDFSMFRFPSRGWQRAPLGTLYRPGYYDRGWAMHGSTSIPPYPASHGCSRISTAACDHLWDRSWFRKGRRVLIHS
ncbi:L,D-transpeptidase family protein [Brachybacterium squillarum]|uniref:L,D-transpeptidase family protein n=1 Tax=Brachybacterium squillarum TaxID=661979 RepID=UPI00026296D8|nr:L,D-transpeptidase family protein [Brachybacterium squillarum]